MIVIWFIDSSQELQCTKQHKWLQHTFRSHGLIIFDMVLQVGLSFTTHDPLVSGPSTEGTICSQSEHVSASCCTFQTNRWEVIWTKHINTTLAECETQSMFHWLIVQSVWYWLKEWHRWYKTAKWGFLHCMYGSLTLLWVIRVGFDCWHTVSSWGKMWYYGTRHTSTSLFGLKSASYKVSI